MTTFFKNYSNIPAIIIHLEPLKKSVDFPNCRTEIKIKDIKKTVFKNLYCIAYKETSETKMCSLSKI